AALDHSYAGYASQARAHLPASAPLPCQLPGRAGRGISHFSCSQHHSPATASAEGFGRPFPLPPDTQFNGRPFPASVTAEGAQLNVPPFPASVTAEGAQLNV